MFTGIVEELGVVERTEIRGRSGRLYIKGKETIVGIRTGDSIAVNGVCLTVTEIQCPVIVVDVMRETLESTNLSTLKRGILVNLERSLKLGDRLGGHYVSGHVDGVGTIRAIGAVENSRILEITCPAELLKYVVPKGSVAVDGISLTIVKTARDVFFVSIIPYTLRITTLGKKHPGDTVNLEVDMIAKYVEKLLEPAERENMSLSFLTEKGF